MVEVVVAVADPSCCSCPLCSCGSSTPARSTTWHRRRQRRNAPLPTTRTAAPMFSKVAPYLSTWWCCWCCCDVCARRNVNGGTHHRQTGRQHDKQSPSGVRENATAQNQEALVSLFSFDRQQANSNRNRTPRPQSLHSKSIDRIHWS